LSLLFAIILTASALLLNNYLVPRYGMEGAAISNLVSYGIYYILIVVTIVPLIRIHVTERRWWSILLLLVTLFGLNWLWQTYLPQLNIWLDSLLRSVVLLGSGAIIAYKAKLSPEINEQLCAIL
jgi:O-antigen/teichoic acid export membrane protein